MFKKILLVLGIIVVTGGLIFGAVNRTLAKTGDESEGLYENGNAAYERDLADGTGEEVSRDLGYGGPGEFQYEEAALPPASATGLSDVETAALLYMREEEKLAHDVYMTLAAQWELPIFLNISRSEQMHSDSVKTLLDRYGLADPALGEVGVFTDPGLQALYRQLIERGNQSLAEALKVGAAIEEIDILDLQKYRSQTDKADLLQVFSNLETGSYNHLKAFTATLSRQSGETYVPHYLSADTYQSIIIASSADLKGTGNVGLGNGSSGGGYRGGRP